MGRTFNVQELMHEIMIALVDTPDEVQITSTESEREGPSDDGRATEVGKVIGKSGRTARSLMQIWRR
jgi:predicted RNA-binding protein YlqC (UPF0109 family)